MTHVHFNDTFSMGLATRMQKILGLTFCHEQRWRILFSACMDQERTMTALIRIALISGKKKKSFTDSETAKECMLAFNEKAIKDEEKKCYSDIYPFSVPAYPRLGRRCLPQLSRGERRRTPWAGHQPVTAQSRHALCLKKIAISDMSYVYEVVQVPCIGSFWHIFSIQS